MMEDNPNQPEEMDKTLRAEVDDEVPAPKGSEVYVNDSPHPETFLIDVPNGYRIQLTSSTVPVNELCALGLWTKKKFISNKKSKGGSYVG